MRARRRGRRTVHVTQRSRTQRTQKIDAASYPCVFAFASLLFLAFLPHFLAFIVYLLAQFLASLA